jgi:putative transposase
MSIPVVNLKLYQILKATASKQLWLKHSDLLAKTYWGKKVLWTGSYFAASCGGVTIEHLKKYVQEQDRSG